MQTDVKKVFYFHADANSLGGYLESPYRVIPSQASVSLPGVGGHASLKTGGYTHEENVVSCSSCYTHVAGQHVKTNGPWKARVTAVAEDIKILDVLTARRAVARLFVEHPADGGPPKVSFAGSYIHDLRFRDKEVALNFNSTLLPEHQRGCDVYNENESFEADIEWPALWQSAHTQSAALHASANAPQWAVGRYGWLDGKQSLSGVSCAACSLLDGMGSVEGTQSYAHFLEVPDIGRFFFAEAMIMPQSIQLTMIRAELGCKTQGMASIASARNNGSPIPP